MKGVKLSKVQNDAASLFELCCMMSGNQHCAVKDEK
jgi:hypothetical protein